MRVAQDVAAPDDPVGEALGLGRADVVLVEHVEHRGAGDPEDHGEGDARQRQRGQHEVLERVPRGVELPGEQAVEDEEPGDAGRIEAAVLAARHGQPAELDREDVLEQEREEEDGDRDADEGEDHRRVVEEARPAAGGEVAERDAERDGDEHREEAQLDRRWEALEEDVQRVRTGEHAGRRAEVALEDAADELAVLDPDGLVEAELGLHGGTGLRGGALTEDRRDGPSGKGAQPQEQQQRQDDEHADHLNQAPDDEPQHEFLLASWRWPPRRSFAGTATSVNG